MNRYEIAIILDREYKKKAFRFPSTKYPTKVFRYMKFCIKKKAVFIGDNISEDALDKAVIKLSQLYKVPIIVPTEKEYRSLMISYSYTQIYYKNNIPNRINFILYNCLEKDLPQLITPFLIILKRAPNGPDNLLI